MEPCLPQKIGRPQVPARRKQMTTSLALRLSILPCLSRAILSTVARRPGGWTGTPIVGFFVVAGGTKKEIAPQGDLHG